MKNSPATTLDLSFLTDEEYEKLMKVLQRDADLQKADKDRISRLQSSVKDEKKKKFMTGQWFHDVQTHRFKEELHGSDLLRASIRKKKSPNQNAQHGGIKGGSKQEIWNMETFLHPVPQRSQRERICGFIVHTIHLCLSLFVKSVLVFLSKNFRINSTCHYLYICSAANRKQDGDTPEFPLKPESSFGQEVPLVSKKLLSDFNSASLCIGKSYRKQESCLDFLCPAVHLESMFPWDWKQAGSSTEDSRRALCEHRIDSKENGPVQPAGLCGIEGANGEHTMLIFNCVYESACVKVDIKQEGGFDDILTADGANDVSPPSASSTANLYKQEELGKYMPESVERVPQNSAAKPVTLSRKISVAEKCLKEEGSSPSKIPVKRKTSREQFKPEVSPRLENSSSPSRKTDASGQSGLSSPEGQSVKSVKSNSNFEVHSMKDMQAEQEPVLDKDQFMSLKKFWEKGTENPGNVQKQSEQQTADARSPQQPPAKPSRSLPVQLNSKMNNNNNNNEEKSQPEYPYRTKHFSHRIPVTSSSEDEMIPVPPPRKIPSSSIPRSTYAKSKGSSISKSSSLTESNEQTSPTEDIGGVSRSSKKSKLPVKASSMEHKAETPPPSERLTHVSEPEVPVCIEEIIVPETKPKVNETLQSRVQILIDTVSSDEDLRSTDANDKAEYTTKHASQKAENDRNADHPEEMSTSSPGNITNARSMVNIYTTTETYTKPATPNHQLLEPERAKELSRSTPALHSETESDTASEISFKLKRHRKTLSSGSNSSDMASVSSISNSVLSVYSGDFGSVDAKGEVQFSLDYDEKNREFQIFVAQCRDLAVVDERKGRSDPYVKTYLLPDKARMGKRKTSVKRKTTNPIYSEVLKYKIEKMALLIQKLNLSVWHNDPLGRNSFLGELEIDLTSWDWSNTKSNWYTLKPRSLSAINGVDHLGVMNLSIKYVPPGSLGPRHPTSGEVHIWVKDTKDLPQLRPSGVDSFVKCYILPDTSKKSYQKTRVIKKDTNPVFNHTIVYDGFHTEDLRDACVELTVWDHEKLNNHFLGGIRLGLGTGYSYGIAVDWMDSTQEEVAFWQEMMQTPNEWIEGSLPLRSLAGRRKFKSAF
ncbi:synaptotagmin-like protein 2 [Gastrophryne carolinensis]